MSCFDRRPRRRLPAWGRGAATAVIVVGLAVGCQAQSVAAPIVVGPSYPVAEPDLLTWIEHRLQAAQASGTIDRQARAATQRAERYLSEPPPLDGITRAPRDRRWTVDPTFTVTAPVRDARGALLVAAGTRINPLDTVSLSRPLILFDARDPAQVAFAERYLQQAPHARPVLTGGKVFELMRAWQRPVYFDQRGTLVRRLGIRHVPAIVAQDGPRLRIDEHAL